MAPWISRAAANRPRAGFRVSNYSTRAAGEACAVSGCRALPAVSMVRLRQAAALTRLQVQQFTKYHR